MSPELTESGFLAFYPQFASFTPGVVLAEYLRQANARFSGFGEDTGEARRLYVAHKLTLYSATSLPDHAEPTKAMIADAGSGARNRVSSKKVGEVSVTYSAAASASRSAAGLRDLPETVYGLQLLSLLRMYGFAKYLP